MLVLRMSSLKQQILLIPFLIEKGDNTIAAIDIAHQTNLLLHFLSHSYNFLDKVLNGCTNDHVDFPDILSFANVSMSLFLLLCLCYFIFSYYAPAP